MKTLICTLVLLLSGCATLVSGGPDHVTVNSEPQGAKVYLDGVPKGKTPVELALRRDSEGVVTIKKPCYEQVVYDKDKVANGWVFGNILLGGLIGLTIDLATSNQGKYPEEPIYVNLQKKPKCKVVRRSKS